MNKAKNLTVLLLAVFLFTGFAQNLSTVSAGGKQEQTTGTAAKKKAGLLISYTGNPFMAMLADEFRNAFERGGYEFHLGVADLDSKKQIEQTENMITMEMNILVVISVDPTSMIDVLQRAKSNGIKVIDFTTRTGVSDMFIGANEKNSGLTVTDMASDWINKVFPSAAPGSVQVAVMEFNGTPEAVERCEGLREIAAKNPKVHIKKIVESLNTTDAARQAAENLLLTDPDLNVILTYNAGMGLGVNSYVMTPGSPIKDKSKFGVFSVDNETEALIAVQGSVRNESVLRGLTQLGGPIMDTINNVVGYADQLLDGKTVPDDFAIVYKITPDNVGDYLR
jgi:ABC-type sugar transport system substrate-binding protein